MTKTNRIEIFDSWRGLLIMMMVMWHLGYTWAYGPTCLAVGFFFMISGFLLARRYGGEAWSGGKWRAFVGERALRFYPLHWLALAAFVLVQWAFYTVKFDYTIVLNALLIHAYFPVHDIFSSYNTPSWFLCALLLCYLCTPAVLRAVYGFRLRNVIASSIVILVVLAALWATCQEGAREYLHVMPLLRLVDFVLGAVCWRLYDEKIKNRTQSLSQRHILLLELLTIVLVASYIVLADMYLPVLRPYYNPILWMPAAVSILFVGMISNGRQSFIFRVLSCKPLCWLGIVSMEIFLFHGVASVLAGTVGESVVYHFGLPFEARLLTLLLAPLFAAIVHYGVSRPLYAWARGVTHDHTER